jgi:hypothetical protein
MIGHVKKKKKMINLEGFYIFYFSIFLCDYDDVTIHIDIVNKWGTIIETLSRVVWVVVVLYD